MFPAAWHSLSRNMAEVPGAAEPLEEAADPLAAVAVGIRVEAVRAEAVQALPVEARPAAAAVQPLGLAAPRRPRR